MPFFAQNKTKRWNCWRSFGSQPITRERNTENSRKMAKKSRPHSKNKGGVCSGVFSLVKGLVILTCGLGVLANIHWHFGTVDNQFYQHETPETSTTTNNNHDSNNADIVMNKIQHDVDSKQKDANLENHLVPMVPLEESSSIGHNDDTTTNEQVVVKHAVNPLDTANSQHQEQVQQQMAQGHEEQEEQKHEQEGQKKQSQRPTVELDGVPLHLTPPLIVGGTDGSGTRGVVALLLSSGVLMLSDAGGADGGCQYDVHGKELHPQG